jgi:hypothetical protein
VSKVVRVLRNDTIFYSAVALFFSMFLLQDENEMVAGCCVLFSGSRSVVMSVT